MLPGGARLNTRRAPAPPHASRETRCPTAHLMAGAGTDAGQPLPQSNRDEDHLQGHWLLARLGKRVLRPGGIGLTRTLLARAQVADADVLELAPGLGRTAAEILIHHPKSFCTITAAKETSGSPMRLIPGCPRPASMSS